MKHSLNTSNFLEAISSLSHSIVFLFLCIVHLQLSYLFLLFSGTLHSVGFIFPFIPCLFLLFFLAIFKWPVCLLYFLFFGMVLVHTSCTLSWTSIHSSSGTLSIKSNPLNLSLPLYNGWQVVLLDFWMYHRILYWSTMFLLKNTLIKCGDSFMGFPYMWSFVSLDAFKILFLWFLTVLLQCVLMKSSLDWTWRPMSISCIDINIYPQIWDTFSYYFFK